MMKPFIRQKPCSTPSASEPADAEHFGPSQLDKLSVFETMRAYGGRLFKTREHLKRLDESCRGLARALPCAPDAIAEWLERMLAESRMPDALLRLSVHWDGDASCLLLIVRAFTAHPAELYEKGVALRTSVMRRAPARAVDAQIKSSQYTAGVLAYLDRLADPAHEVLFLDPMLTVAEGSVSNIFIVKEKCVLTPPAASGILRGVTRSHVMDLARSLGLDVRETPFTRHELYNADECFLTNTSSEVLPVVTVDGRAIGSGRPGPVAQRLKKAFTP